MQTDMFETQMRDPGDVQRFIFAGRALFTIVSKKTGTRYTFRVQARRQDPDGLRFVRVLNGPDNESDYRYIGYLNYKNRKSLWPGSNGLPEAPSFKALDWLVKKLAAGQMPEQVEFYHAGRCGACGKTLTVPESIQTGLGPVCAGRHK